MESAKQAGIPVSVCGEMAGEPEYVSLLVGMGIDELSVAPPVLLPEIKKIIRSVRFDRAGSLAEGVVNAPDPDSALKALEKMNRELLPALPQ